MDVASKAEFKCPKLLDNLVLRLGHYPQMPQGFATEAIHSGLLAPLSSWEDMLLRWVEVDKPGV